MIKYRYLLVILCIPFNPIFAQKNEVPVLEREVTVNINNAPLQEALNDIAKQGDFVFSYNPDAIHASRNVSINVSHRPVRYTLNELFDGTVTYKVRGKYIILQENDNVQLAKKEQVIEGYIYDARSGQKLTETTVYDKDLLASAITDKYGYFRLELPAGQSSDALHISKKGYTDTLLAPLPGKVNYVDVELSKSAAGKGLIEPPSTTVNKKRVVLPQWLIPKKIKINAGNLTDTLFRKVQFSLIPFLSTNKLLTGNVTNNVSINLTAGYVQEVRTIEVGGVLNMVRNNAGVCQLAGAGNIVGQSFHGFQAAGAWNIAGTMDGVQAAGAVNIVRNDAGVCQLAGAGNIVGGSFQGIQAAGAFNVTDKIKGMQVAGAFNTSHKVEGIQVSGALNNATEVTGGQISGFLNRASVVNGFQLAVINIADSCSGIPIGVLSYVKKGYHKLELYADEVFYTNVAFRTGVKHFHNIFLAGIRPGNFDNPLWTFGYGLGTTFGKSGKLAVDIDATVQQIIRNSNFIENNQLYKIYAGIDKNLTPKLSIAAGITYNFFVSKPGSPGYENNYSGITPYTFSDATFSNGINLKTWPGVKIAVRFF